jgi:PST family polysaccharide transporter
MADGKSFLGAVAMSSATVAKLAIQLLVLPILARTLSPADYGLVGVAMPIILLANLLCDGGLGSALSREMSVSRELESAIFWLATGLSIAIGAGICAAAIPLGHVFHQPALPPVLMALTAVLVLSASLSVANARIVRSQRFVLFAIGEVGASLLGAGIALVAARAGLGAWALVLQQLSYWVLKALWIFSASGFRPVPTFDLAAAAPHLKFGAHVVGASLADFAAKNAPIMIIAGYLGSAAAGRYALANQLARIPELVIAAPMFLPLFVMASRTRSEPGALTRMANRMLRVGVTALAPLYCGWILTADLVLPLVLGPKWQGTEVLLRVLVPASFLSCLFVQLAAILQGAGHPGTQFRLSIALAVLVAASTWSGVRFGEAGGVAGITIGTVLMVPVALGALSGQVRIRPAELLVGCAQPAIAAVAMSAALLFLRQELAGWAPWRQLLVLAPGGALLYVVLVFVLSGQRLRDDLRAVLPISAARI